MNLALDSSRPPSQMPRGSLPPSAQKVLAFVYQVLVDKVTVLGRQSTGMEVEIGQLGYPPCSKGRDGNTCRSIQKLGFLPPVGPPSLSGGVALGMACESIHTGEAKPMCKCLCMILL